ncbi:hypothetical protein H0E87_022570 [Populus deltoides]|uniref:Protein kinase domain-containing protein n=1 Tax=Populus deltoides TaxID=3696 RepID=A0A8T2XBR1_POPDE|nr:hypothetical protein H0E87_022570 [Populus deltoides]
MVTYFKHFTDGSKIGIRGTRLLWETQKELHIFIHRDIKSSDVLLDEDYEPKIADFGISKLAEMSLKGCDSSSFAGTHGYIVPAHRIGIWRRGIHCLLGLTHVNDRENVLKVLGEEMASDSVQEDMIKVLKIADL